MSVERFGFWVGAGGTGGKRGNRGAKTGRFEQKETKGTKEIEPSSTGQNAVDKSNRENTDSGAENER